MNIMRLFKRISPSETCVKRKDMCGAYEGLSAELREVLVPLLKEIESLNGRSKQYDERVEKIDKVVYSEVALRQHMRPVVASTPPAPWLLNFKKFALTRTRSLGAKQGKDGE
jgi:hypothetical protein